KGMFGDFVIMRSNGMPVYNFAVVVDDGLMNITHIIRAEEHLSNTGRQILLYRALGFPLPVFAHTALILAQDGSKLSKRHGATSVEEYQRRGYLSEALFNFLSILGWTPPEEGKDKLARAEIIKAFGLEKISKSSAKFDNGKLDWLNGEYLKELPLKQMISLLRPYVKNAYDTSVYSEEKLDEILAILAPGLNFLEQVVEESKLFFEAPLSVDEEYQEPLYLKLVARLKEEIQQNPAPDKEFYQELVKNLGKELGLKGKNLFMPIRQYITGQSHGRDLYALMELLGQERLLSRLAAWL
ncbi:MAG: glutamate--tRNA ligase, partial [Spirochaetae bacterium HGW-Spirochaetae-6]